MRYILFILIFTVALFSDSLQRDKEKKVVIDNENNLMWVDDETSVSVNLIHEEAEDYCSSLSHAGYNNWRLANLKEIALIVDKKNHPKYINKAFKYSINTGYWASESHWRTLWFYADYMHFVSGTAYFDSRHKKKLVRCVRNTR